MISVEGNVLTFNGKGAADRRDRAVRSPDAETEITLNCLCRPPRSALRRGISDLTGDGTGFLVNVLTRIKLREDTRIIPRWNRTAATSQRLASISAGSDVQSGCHAMKKSTLLKGYTVAQPSRDL